MKYPIQRGLKNERKKKKTSQFYSQATHTYIHRHTHKIQKRRSWNHTDEKLNISATECMGKSF